MYHVLSQTIHRKVLRSEYFIGCSLSSSPWSFALVETVGLICRDYSMYSLTTSENEGSVRKAQSDLDRCAYILNEMLDNGAGVLGV